MRKLTLKRKKKMVACVMKTFIYLETKVDEDLVLDDIPCKKVGVLKNGKSITIDIPNEECNLFVVFSKPMPNKFKANYLIKAGDNDINLVTFPRYDPFKGNPFIIAEK